MRLYVDVCNPSASGARARLRGSYWPRALGKAVFPMWPWRLGATWGQVTIQLPRPGWGWNGGREGGCNWHKCQDDFSCLFPALFPRAPRSDAFGVFGDCRFGFSPATFKMQVPYFESPDTIGVTEGKCGLQGFSFLKWCLEKGNEIALPVAARRVPCALRLFPPSPSLTPSFCPSLSFPHFCSISISFPWWWDSFRCRCFKLMV